MRSRGQLKLVSGPRVRGVLHDFSVSRQEIRDTLDGEKLGSNFSGEKLDKNEGK